MSIWRKSKEVDRKSHSKIYRLPTVINEIMMLKAHRLSEEKKLQEKILKEERMQKHEEMKKKGICIILKEHADELRSDPERLSTSFIRQMIGGSEGFGARYKSCDLEEKKANEEMYSLGRFGARYKSCDLEEMGWAERLILNPKMLELMSMLKVAQKVKSGDGFKWIGGSIVLDKNDKDFPEISEYFEECNKGVNGACHQINSVFVALQVPFYATAYATNEAQKITKTKSRGENVGEQYTVVEADKVRIYRRSQMFDINVYGVKESQKYKEGKIKTAYHQPTSGQLCRTEKWIEENGSVVGTEVLKAIGLNIQVD